MIRGGGVVVGCLLVSALPTAAQEESLDRFLSELSRSAERFEDLSVAVQEGYRKLGPDFPGHGRALDPSLSRHRRRAGPRSDPRSSATRWSRENAGSYRWPTTKVLGPTDRPPSAPFPPDAWHDHTGGVDEESLLLSGPHSTHTQDEGFRLSMVHVWLKADNPAGILAQNNWALPFLRVTALPPPDPSSEVARALALATESGAAFYEQLLREGVGLEEPELGSARLGVRSRCASKRVRSGAE